MNRPNEGNSPVNNHQTYHPILQVQLYRPRDCLPERRSAHGERMGREGGRRGSPTTVAVSFKVVAGKGLFSVIFGDG